MKLTPEQFYAGDVARWHASQIPEMQDCGDTIKTHQKRCVDLVNKLFPDASDNLKDATRWHDQPEVILGDVPFTAKRDYPALAAVWELLEADVIRQYGVPQPASGDERDVIKLVDRLDAYLTVRKFAPSALDEPDWIDARRDILLRAERVLVWSSVNVMVSWNS